MEFDWDSEKYIFFCSAETKTRGKRMDSSCRDWTYLFLAAILSWPLVFTSWSCQLQINSFFILDTGVVQQHMSNNYPSKKIFGLLFTASCIKEALRGTEKHWKNTKEPLKNHIKTRENAHSRSTEEAQNHRRTNEELLKKHWRTNEELAMNYWWTIQEPLKKHWGTTYELINTHSRAVEDLHAIYTQSIEPPKNHQGST